VFPAALVIGGLGYVIEGMNHRRYNNLKVDENKLPDLFGISSDIYIDMLSEKLFFHPTGMVSSKYTPYAASIQQTRIDRLTSEEALSHVTEAKQQRYENVLDKNLSASLSRPKN
jgi:hypothetical protein